MFRRFILLLCLGVATLRADDFGDGNVAFERGDFPAAVKAYAKAASQPGAGANVFYNLGNAQFRAGEPGKAALSYERALVLAPRHPEALANLAYLRRQSQAQAPEVRGFAAPAANLGADTTLVLFCAGLWALLGAAALGVFGFGRVTVLGVAAVGLALAAWAGTSLALLGGGRRAPDRLIVTAAKGARATFAPAENARTAANLGAGSDVRFLQFRAAWTYVQLPDGGRAWLPSETVERIRPPQL